MSCCPLRRLAALAVSVCAFALLIGRVHADPTDQQTQTFALHHVMPDDLLLTLQWDGPAHLPPGISRVTPLYKANALEVTGTPDGLKAVARMLPLLDITPRKVSFQVQIVQDAFSTIDDTGINFDLVPIPSPSGEHPGYLHYAAGPVASALQKAVTGAASSKTADIYSPVEGANNHTSSVIQAIHLRSGIVYDLPVRAAGVELTPRINSDNTVTVKITLNYGVIATSFIPLTFPPVNDLLMITTTRTVRNGDTFVVGRLRTPSAHPGPELLVFVTPTIGPAAVPSP